MEHKAPTRSRSGSALPVVDLAPFFSTAGDAAAARARATEAVREACMDTGFFRVVNHGVPRELMARMLELSAAFFALPDEEKAKLRPAEGSSSTPLPAGYLRPPADSPDKNEYLLVFNPELVLNVYPAEPAGLRDAIEECYAKLTNLGLLIQEILNECMGLLLGRRWRPGDPRQRWLCPAEPVEGTIIANIGDIVQVLSNKKFKSPTHRVVRKLGAHRHSLAFFVNLHEDKWVEPLPQFAANVGEAPRYIGFKYGDYMQLRLKNTTHPPSRPEDAVGITHYAI
ncbi:hypothetical protein ACQ4PT_053867 [Festuca glaucescens]